MLVGLGLENIDDPTGILVVVETFKHHVISLRLVIVGQLINLPLGLHLKREPVLANSTLKLLPVVR